jgi:hypothetical protein
VANGIVDIYISKELADHTIVLIYNCEGGLPNDLHLIGDDHTITLQRATLEGNVRIVHEQGSDCAFNYVEVDPATARKYRLPNGSRFMLDYTPNENKLRMRRITTSRAHGQLLIDPRKSRDRTIIIGYTLLSRLGIANSPNSTITLSMGSTNKKLKVEIPDNELETSLWLTSTNLRKFGLSPGKKWGLEYNQLTQTLRVLTIASTASRRTKSALRSRLAKIKNNLEKLSRSSKPLRRR